MRPDRSRITQQICKLQDPANFNNQLAIDCWIASILTFGQLNSSGTLLTLAVYLVQFRVVLTGEQQQIGRRCRRAAGVSLQGDGKREAMGTSIQHAEEPIQQRNQLFRHACNLYFGACQIHLQFHIQQ